MIVTLVLAATACTRDIALPSATAVPLATVQPLSSKTSAKGDLVALRTTADVVADGVVAIPSGTAATGQIVEARSTGALGQSGKLVLAPLFLRIGDTTIRLTGKADGHGTLSAGQVLGLGLVSAAFSGRSALIPGGTAVPAETLRPVTLPCNP